MGWAWEVGRTPSEMEEAGWAGVLTFPREVTLGDDGNPRFVPARELLSLRREAPLPEALRAPAFEVSGRGLRLSLDGTPVVDLPGEGTVTVDGSIVEAYGADGRTVTTRAYPGAGSAWSVTGEVTGAWVLEPAPGPGGDR